jgi:predicted SnoaL-like aldol condensation-catalyzing enzyme
MKTRYLLIGLCFVSIWAKAQEQDEKMKDQTTINKEIARNFYQDLWFTNNTDNYKKYFTEQYVVHDIGNRKGVVEPAIEQKNIADFFWKNGEFDSKIDYQIAEGDLVATRWTASFKSSTVLGWIAFETKNPISVINVFRIKDGKIVELWNHRHDIETPQTLKFTFTGLFIGLLIALIPAVLLFRLKIKLKHMN